MKRLLLFAGIVAVIGVGIFVLAPQRESAIQENTDQNGTPQETQFFEPTQELIQTVTSQVLGARFNAQTATHTTANLDKTGGQELIIGAVEGAKNLTDRPVTAIIQVVTVTNPQGNYQYIGAVEYQEWMRGVPEVKELRDVTGDGVPEAIVSLLYGGASSWAEGVLQFDIPNRKVRWVQLQIEGAVHDAIFVLAGSVGHYNTFQFIDVNNDGSLELVEIFARVILDETECSAFAYAWNGQLFARSETLSNQVLSRLDDTCAL